jgi:hypothetical protein
MRNKTIVITGIAICGISMIACGTARAQRGLENAAEFQQEIVRNAEQKAEDREAGQSPQGDISWGDSADTGSVSSAGEAVQQAQ